MLSCNHAATTAPFTFLQTNSQIAQVYGWYEVMGLGLEFDRQFIELIEAVTEADVQNVAQKYFTAPAISVVGSAEALKQLI